MLAPGERECIGARMTDSSANSWYPGGSILTLGGCFGASSRIGQLIASAVFNRDSLRLSRMPPIKK